MFGTAEKIEAAQVSLVADIKPGREGAFENINGPDRFIEFNNELYFSADDGIHGIELWKYDGSDASLVADIRPGKRSSLDHITVPQNNNFTIFNETLYFSAVLPGRGRELLRFDGNTVSLAADIFRGRQASLPDDLIVFDDTLYFSANIPLGGRGLWRFDGNTATQIIDSNHQLYDPSGLTLFNDELYFQSSVGNNTELWKFDGTQFSQVATIAENAFFYPGEKSTVFNNELYFNLSDGLWKFDGTQLEQVTDSLAFNLVVFKNSLYFNLNDEPLWRYDGSSLSQVNLPSVPRYISNSLVFKNELYFSGYDPTHGEELWKYDGRNFSLVADLFLGTTTFSSGVSPNSSSPSDLIVLGDELFFTAIDESHGRELWKLTPTQAIPEPLTLLGAGTAVGFGIFFKRKIAQKKH